MFWLFGLAHWLVLVTTAERSGAVYSTDITRLHLDNIYELKLITMNELIIALELYGTTKALPDARKRLLGMNMPIDKCNRILVLYNRLNDE